MLPWSALAGGTVALPLNTEILETLGEGSFGAVYVALLTEGAIRRTVVLKVLKSEWADHPEILVRSRDEATLLALLNHDNIVRVEQLIEIEGRPALVMEHVQGLTLERLLKGNGPLPVSIAVGIAAKVASALDAAFNQLPPGAKEPLRVVHRDIKPSNIIVSVAGSVKVLDFGTARAQFGERGAHTSALTLGSPLYMAPECFDGAEADPTVDIYALGSTLFELLAGVPLGRLSVHPDKHGVKLEERLAQLSSPELVEGGPVLKAVRNLIGRCMRYEAQRRPTAADMRRLCNEFLKRLPRGTLSMDQFAQVTVEPLYNARETHDPIPLEATLGRSGLRDLDQDEPKPWGSTKPELPSPTPAPVPVNLEPPPAAKAKPVVLPPPPEDEEEDQSGMGRLMLFGALGILLGLAVVGGILALVLQQQPGSSEPAITPEVQEPVQPLVPEGSPVDGVGPQTDPPQADLAKTDPPDADPLQDVPKLQPVEEAEKAPARVEPPVAKVDPAPSTQEPDPAGQVIRVEVRVASVPAGARVRVGGESVQAPGVLSLPAGTVTARVSFPDSSGGSCVLTAAEGAKWKFRADAGSVVCP
ncbi:MAG: serine/threonine protein kinase [Cognaticolwellia sp.]